MFLGLNLTEKKAYTRKENVLKRKRLQKIIRSGRSTLRLKKSRPINLVKFQILTSVVLISPKC